MVSDQFHKYIDRDQIRTEQGTWATIIEIVEEEIKKMPYKLRGQEVSARLEMSPKRKSLAKAHALFDRGLKAVGGNESKMNVVHGKIQISFFVGSAMAAKYTPEGKGVAGERRYVKPGVFAAICTFFSEALFEAIVKSS